MARGCVFDCAFCSDAKGSRGKLVYHLADRVAADVATIVQWPEAEWVDAGASTANASEESFWAVCDGIRRGDPQQRLVYSFQLYPALVRPSHQEALRGIRIGKHLIGLQSTSKATFASMRRSGTLDQLRRAIDILHETGPVSVSVIMGLPGETFDSFAHMMDSLIEIPGLHISVHRLLVLPGTDFHTRHEALGLGVDGSRFYRATRSSTMTEADLVRAQELVMNHAVREGKSHHGRQRVDWTNFDAQLTPFAAPTPPGQQQ
jgi:oxygen-independent coproporphyrinogen-3 oxidase